MSLKAKEERVKKIVKENGKGALYTFTREFFHTEATKSASAAAVRRWKQDYHQFPTDAYEEENVLWKGTKWRVLAPEERAH